MIIIMSVITPDDDKVGNDDSPKSTLSKLMTEQGVADKEIPFKYLPLDISKDHAWMCYVDT